MYGDPPPTAIRSWTSSRLATDQPSSTSPTTSATGIGTSSKNSWQNSVEPSVWRICSTVTPGWWISTMNIVRPRCLGTSQLVRARHMA